MSSPSRRSVTPVTVVLVTALLLLSVPLQVDAKEERGEGMSFFYRGVVEEVDKGLEPGPSGGPVKLVYDRWGDRALLWGYEHVNDLRVLDPDLDTLAVLEPPYEDFAVTGATIDYEGDWVIAWGRTPAHRTDIVAVYNLTDYRLDTGFIPPGTIPLEEIDDIDLMAGGEILVAAGRDEVGTNRLVFIETRTVVELRNDTVPGDRSVLSIDHDEKKMIILLDEGSILVYQTFDWGLEVDYRVFDGAFTAFEVKKVTDWHFGNADGDVVGMTYYDDYSFSNITASRGPIVGIFSVEYYQHQVVAIPAEGPGTELEVWLPEGAGWKVQSSSVINGTVVSLVGDPADNTTFAVCLSDGSVDFYRVVIVKVPLPPREPTWGDTYGKPVGISGVLLVLALAGFLILRRRRAAEV